MSNCSPDMWPTPRNLKEPKAVDNYARRLEGVDANLPKTVKLISLGCSKNLVDSEVMLGLLKESEYEISLNELDDSKADITIINTCAFIESAKQESIDTILEVASDIKSDQKIIVTGCLAQRYVNELAHEIPEIDAFVGTGEFHKIVDVCDSLFHQGDGKIHLNVGTPKYLYNHRTPRITTTPPHYAYLKIAEGCDKKCSFCAIPMMRGAYRSRSIKSLVREAKSLAREGVKELILISQDSTYYGVDRYGKVMLPTLLRELTQIDELEWIRLMYAYPSQVNDELLEVIAQESKICSYLDMPVQHIDDVVLYRMNRGTTPNLIRSKLTQIRKIIPDVILRTSLLVGFPSETDEQFEELVDFVHEAEFDHLGVFAYSQEDGTPAARLEEQIPEQVKQERLDYLANIQADIAIRKRKKMIGRKTKVLVDAVDESSSIARTAGQAPEIDDVVYIRNAEIPIGEFVSVEIKSTRGFDLIA